MAGTKLHIVSCFALFALLVAPFAWRQTQLERVELPADRIRALAWNASRFAAPARHVVRVYTVVGAGHADAEDAVAFATVRDDSASVAYTVGELPLSVETKQQLQNLHDQPQRLDDALLNVLPSQTAAVDFSVVLLCRADADARAASSPAITVGKHRHAWASACSPRDPRFADALAQLAESHLFPSESSASPSKTSRARVAVKYRLQFSLLQESGDVQWAWEFEKLQTRFLAPMLKKLESVAQFTVEYQTLQFARLAKEIHTDASSGGGHYVTADDLKHFKSTNDFLTSSVLADREQVLHFMAALPAADHTPLVIKSDGDRVATAFEIPSWGVVVILDPRQLARSRASEAKELQRVMGRFISELRTLLGLPSFVKRQRTMLELKTGIEFLPSPRDGVAQWELDVVVRRLLRRHVRASIETLQSIVQLVTDMPQMSVLDRVAQRIAHAVELVERVLCVDLTEAAAADCAASLDAASEAALLEIARRAVEEADAAYYDHTMIRQLYFPQEQMLGVFAPLLAPLLLPFFLGWIREMKQLRKKRQAKAAVTET